MSFDAASFLAGLVDKGGDDPPPEAAVKAAAESAPLAAPDLFADWLLRPDAAGRLGWERPDLDDADRWWARCSFDDLPDPRGEE